MLGMLCSYLLSNERNSMKLNNIFKLFTVVVLFFTAAILNSFAAEQITLDKIVVEEDVNNILNISLVFNEKFTGNAFIQDRENGSYFVFIPETYMSKRGVKTLFREPENKTKIKIDVEELPYVKGNLNSKYVKLTVKVLRNYSIQLLSKTEEEFKEEPPIPFTIEKHKLITFGLLLLAAVLLIGVLRTAKRNEKLYYSNYRQPYPVSYITDTEKEKEADNTKEEQVNAPAENNATPPDTHVLPKLNIKESMKAPDSDSFSCFDLPFAGEIENTPLNSDLFKNTLKETASTKREKVLKNNVTNPITKTKSQEASEFSLPVVDDIVVIESSKPKKEKSKEPELLSELRITPRKGFYLTTIDDMFALFGFVDNNVYLLKKFTDLSQINLQARFYDRQDSGDLYIVRLDSYKAMVEISDSGMKELTVL